MWFESKQSPNVVGSEEAQTSIVHSSVVGITGVLSTAVECRKHGKSCSISAYCAQIHTLLHTLSFGLSWPFLLLQQRHSGLCYQPWLSVQLPFSLQLFPTRKQEGPGSPAAVSSLWFGSHSSKLIAFLTRHPTLIHFRLSSCVQWFPSVPYFLFFFFN